MILRVFVASPGACDLKVRKESAASFLARSNVGVDYINNANKDDYGRGNDIAAVGEVRFDLGLLMLVAPEEQVFLTKRVLAKAGPGTKIYLPNVLPIVTTMMTITMALVCSKM